MGTVQNNEQNKNARGAIKLPTESAGTNVRKGKKTIAQRS